MEQTSILPLPKVSQIKRHLEFEADSRQVSELDFLNCTLDKLRSGQMKWEDFLLNFDLEDPALKLASTKEGDTILHLAVIAKKNEIADLLLKDPVLASKKNRYGMTPKEVFQFLRKEPAPFSAEPRVEVKDSNHLEPLSKISFLPHPVFESDKILYDILFRSRKAKMEDKILPEKIWMGVYFDREIQKGLHPAVSIRLVDEEVGLGVFAEQKIPSCGYVGEYTGVVQERKKKHLKDKVYCVRYTVWDMGKRNFVIDAEEKGNFTRFINHSATPNLSLQSVYWRGMPRMIFIALKEISEGTQLTFDYGSFFWKECQQTPRLF